MTIDRYVLVSLADDERDHEYDSFQEAIAAAGLDHAIVERHYEYTDSELVWTPDGTLEWPPKQISLEE